MPSVIAIGMSEDYINSIDELRYAYDNSLKHLPEEFTEENVISMFQGIVKKSLILSKENFIHADWSNPVFVKLFNGIYRHLMINICKTNSRFCKALLAGEYSCGVAALIDEFEKDQKKWKKIRDELELKENESIAKLNITTDVTCRRCHKNEVFMMQIQTRSADEPETLFFQCMSCDNKWRKAG